MENPHEIIHDFFKKLNTYANQYTVVAKLGGGDDDVPSTTLNALPQLDNKTIKSLISMYNTSFTNNKNFSNYNNLLDPINFNNSSEVSKLSTTYFLNAMNIISHSLIHKNYSTNETNEDKEKEENEEDEDNEDDEDDEDDEDNEDEDNENENENENGEYDNRSTSTFFSNTSGGGTTNKNLKLYVSHMPDIVKIQIDIYVMLSEILCNKTIFLSDCNKLNTILQSIGETIYREMLYTGNKNNQIIVQSINEFLNIIYGFFKVEKKNNMNEIFETLKTCLLYCFQFTPIDPPPVTDNPFILQSSTKEQNNENINILKSISKEFWEKCTLLLTLECNLNYFLASFIESLQIEIDEKNNNFRLLLKTQNKNTSQTEVSIEELKKNLISLKNILENTKLFFENLKNNFFTFQMN